MVSPLWNLQFILKTRKASYWKTQCYTLKQPLDLPECKIRKQLSKTDVNLANAREVGPGGSHIQGQPVLETYLAPMRLYMHA